MLAGASFTFCSVAAAVTTIVSPALSTAIAGSARDIADAQRPPRTMGFNLNIPFLHEIKDNKANWYYSHCEGFARLHWQSVIF